MLKPVAILAHDGPFPAVGVAGDAEIMHGVPSRRPPPDAVVVFLLMMAQLALYACPLVLNVRHGYRATKLLVRWMPAATSASVIFALMSVMETTSVLCWWIEVVPSPERNAMVDMAAHRTSASFRKNLFFTRNLPEC